MSTEGYFKDGKNYVPFKRMNEEKKRDSFNIVMNEKALVEGDFTRAMLEDAKKALRQEKDSTAIKQLAAIGTKVIHDPETAEILGVVLDNIRRNRRTGVPLQE